MEVVRKRRASKEVQELMNAVKSDYEFFARLDSSFPSAPSPAKRQRALSDNVLVQYAVVRPKPRYSRGVNLSERCEKYLDTNFRLSEDISSRSPELIQIPLEDQHQGRMFSREQSRYESQELCGGSREYNETSREDEQIFQKSTPDFWASHNGGELPTRKRHRHPFTTQISNQSNLEPWPEKTAHEGFICLSSQPIILGHAADDTVAWKRRMVQKFSTYKPSHSPLEPVDEEQVLSDVPPLLTRGNTNRDRRFSEDESRHHMIFSRSSRINVRGFPTCEPLSHDTPNKVRGINIEIEPKTVERQQEVEKIPNSAKNSSDSDSENDLIIVESTSSSPISRQWCDNQSPSNQKPDEASDNHVTSSETDENSAERKDVSPIESKSPDGGNPCSLNDELWPDFVITRVSSLLWLDKDVVYPITLDEMRRRIQDPENFSFQMLIAYVRHSRAKGRQFLDYWKCRPTGKTSRPNVLSKLCEADVKELVNGIQKVNEEYFPTETLARNVAASILQKKGNKLTEREKDGKEEQRDLFVKEKVKAIEKSRSVFKILQTTLQSSQDDKRFATFNVASHNAGLDNIKNSLTFLDSIFERIQRRVQGNQKTLPVFTA